VELDNGFAVEEIGNNVMKIKNYFPGSDGILGNNVEYVR
jgi:hypothetical protein